MSAVFAYVTASSPEEADRLVEAVVGARLAACANVIDGMRSAYWWQGRLERAKETIVIFKTTRERYAALEEKVKATHSYAVPCVVALPVEAGSAAYLGWIEAETR
jgi:periplasmic divalent cation tolerance protein